MKRLLKEIIRRNEKYILGILICGIISSFFSVQLTKFIMHIIDGVITTNEQIPTFISRFFYENTIYAKIVVFAIFMISFIIIIATSNYIRNYLTTKMRLGVNQNLKMLLINHTTYLEYNEYAKQERSQILQRISTDSANILDFVMDKYNLIVDSVFILLFSMAEMVRINILVTSVIGIIILIIIYLLI